MTAAQTPLDPEDDAMIRRLAEMDMAAAEKAHAALMAADQPAEIAAALLAYQRAARSARQTLMLKARLKRMTFDVTPLRQAAAAVHRAADLAEDAATEAAFFARVEPLHDAVGRVAAAAHPGDAERQRALEAGHDALVDVEMELPDFLHHPLEAHVVAHCEALGLPRDLAARWRELPKPPPLPLTDAEWADLMGDPNEPGELNPDRRESG
jgi:hypothetical protein